MNKFEKIIGGLTVLGALLWVPRMSFFINKSFAAYAQSGGQGSQFRQMILLIHMVFPVLFLSGILIGGILLMCRHQWAIYVILISLCGIMTEQIFFG